jgi:hypothetical protein
MLLRASIAREATRRGETLQAVPFTTPEPVTTGPREDDAPQWGPAEGTVDPMDHDDATVLDGLVRQRAEAMLDEVARRRGQEPQRARIVRELRAREAQRHECTWCGEWTENAEGPCSPECAQAETEAAVWRERDEEDAKRERVRRADEAGLAGAYDAAQARWKGEES